MQLQPRHDNGIITYSQFELAKAQAFELVSYAGVEFPEESTYTHDWTMTRVANAYCEGFDRFRHTIRVAYHEVMDVRHQSLAVFIRTVGYTAMTKQTVYSRRVHLTANEGMVLHAWEYRDLPIMSPPPPEAEPDTKLSDSERQLFEAYEHELRTGIKFTGYELQMLIAEMRNIARIEDE